MALSQAGRYTFEVAKLEAAAKAAESDAAAPREAADGELPPPPPASAPKAEHVAYVASATGVPAEEAEQMKKADLVELARAAAGG